MVAGGTAQCHSDLIQDKISSRPEAAHHVHRAQLFLNTSRVAWMMVLLMMCIHFSAERGLCLFASLSVLLPIYVLQLAGTPTEWMPCETTCY